MGTEEKIDWEGRRIDGKRKSICII